MKKESRCIILSIIFLGMVFEVLYFFIMHPDDGFIIAGGVAILMFVTYFLLNSLSDLRKEREEQHIKEQESMIKNLMEEMITNRNNSAFENVEKFEKAIYMALQNGTKAISEEIQTLDNHMTNGIEGIIQQVGESGERNAKINVKYGRENTKSLMVFQKKVFDNVIQGMEETVHEVSQMTEKLNHQLEQVENAIKDIKVGIPEVSASVFQAAPMVENSQDMDIPLETEEQENLGPEIQEETINPEAESETQEELINSEIELPVVEDVSIPEPEVSEDPNHMMTPEEIAALVAGGTSEEPKPEPEVSEDPNHMMTPEEIAALLAGNN